MDPVFSRLAALLGSCMLSIACLQAATASDATPVSVIVVKGAWSSASDSLTAVPERGTLSDLAYGNSYFDLAYGLSREWTEMYEGPPPSDSGYYVLAQIEAAGVSAGSRAHLLIAAQDMFFTLAPAKNALESINYYKDHLDTGYRIERAPTEAHIGGRTFARFDYTSPIAKLHWRVLATEIRCHMVQFVFTGGSVRQLESLIENMNTMGLPVETVRAAGNGGATPTCIRDFASAANLIEHVDPVFYEPRFNAVPVRIIIDAQGRVRHIHFLSAFPEQVKGISDALSRWRFKPHVLDGRPVEVETGILFGHAPQPTAALR